MHFPNSPDSSRKEGGRIRCREYRKIEIFRTSYIDFLFIYLSLETIHRLQLSFRIRFREALGKWGEMIDISLDFLL